MTHDETLEFESEDPYNSRWTDAAFAAMSSGSLVAIELDGQVIVAGPCPRCGGEVAFIHNLDAYGGEGADQWGVLIAGKAKDDDYITIDVSCRCVGRHPKRPESETCGCGISFAISLEIRRP